MDSENGPVDGDIPKKPVTVSKAWLLCQSSSCNYIYILSGQAAAHTIGDVMFLLQSAVDAGLPMPSEQQQAKKRLGCLSGLQWVVLRDSLLLPLMVALRSFTVNTSSCTSCSINVIAGAQKQFYVTKSIDGVGEWVRRILNLKALANTVPRNSDSSVPNSTLS